MSDNTAEGNTTPAGTPASTAGSGGLIDVGGLNFDELYAVITNVDLKLALDYIVASGENGSGYHGFNSSILQPRTGSDLDKQWASNSDIQVPVLSSVRIAAGSSAARMRPPRSARHGWAVG